MECVSPNHCGPLIYRARSHTLIRPRSPFAKPQQTPPSSDPIDPPFTADPTSPMPADEPNEEPSDCLFGQDIADLVDATEPPVLPGAPSTHGFIL